VPIVLAIFSAVCFGSSHVTAKRGLHDTSVFAGLLIQLGAAFVVVLAALLLDPPVSISVPAVAVFAAAGLIAPGTARATALAGVDRLGPSVAVPIQQGTRPILTVALAAVVLGETIGVVQLIGVAAIAFGGWKLSRAPSAAETTPADGDPPRGSPSRTFRPGVIFPLITAVCYAASDVIVKVALGRFPSPTIGAAIGIGAALVIWAVAAGAIPSVRGSLRFGRNARWFIASGSFMGAAILLMFHALQGAAASVVGPIIATQTMFVFLLSTLLLRQLERVTIETVISGSAVVAGTVLVSI
jgi:drug/metabolite transporter (DMT)-like permease